MISAPPVQLPKTLRLTHEQFYEMVQANPELCFEQAADGTVIVMPSTGSEGGNRNAELTGEFVIWNRRVRSGKVFDSSTGFRLPNGATRSPDVAWIGNERWTQISSNQRKGFAPICPDFVLELASESDDVDVLRRKMVEYLDNGSRLGWLILPGEEVAEIYRPGHETRRQGFERIISGEDILPGLELDLKKLFEEQ